ncbi:phosphonate C-P lyase system protein PhnH [Primorskyibacter sp. 2E107]|uniref:phosphonate C-P lyase system protein PhnH n=1 Tax=Primorskyibacter sp. 2E107 TaxID=3403458 RepID=UPI003AF6E762
MTITALDGGFADPARQSAEVFRGVMTAVAMPGTIHSVDGASPPAPLSTAAGTVLLTLCDADTPLYLAGDMADSAVKQWIAFHIGAPLVGPRDCAFALGRWPDLLPLDAYPIGTPDYPDRSATLIVETTHLYTGGARLTGPGIRTQETLSLPETGIDAFVQNHTLFPLGLDFVFTCGDRLAALPRSTQVNAPMGASEVR